jgi:hypothetical protein
VEHRRWRDAKIWRLLLEFMELSEYSSTRDFLDRQSERKRKQGGHHEVWVGEEQNTLLLGGLYSEKGHEEDTNTTDRQILLAEVREDGGSPEQVPHETQQLCILVVCCT